MDSLKLLAKARNAVRMLENNECGFSKEQEEAAMRTLDYYMTGNTHFTEISARGCIAQMYYYKTDTEKEFAPFFDYQAVKNIYKEYSYLVPDYNVWDFAVTMNLIYSKHISIIKKWSKNKDILNKRIAELAISFLTDDNTTHPTDKIWWYMNN